MMIDVFSDDVLYSDDCHLADVYSSDGYIDKKYQDFLLEFQDVLRTKTLMEVIVDLSNMME